MAGKLTSTAIIARKTIKYGSVGFVIFLIVRGIAIIAWNAYIASLPPKVAPPTVGYGVLAEIPFPKQKAELPELEYKVETATGFLPSFPEQMKVFVFQAQRSDFYSYDKMVERAKVFGFTRDPIEIGQRTFRFIHASVPFTLESDVVTSAFTLTYNLAADSTPLLTRSRTKEAATKEIQDRLNTADLIPSDLNGPIKETFLKVEGQNLVRALSLADAQMVQINMFRKNVDRVEDERTGEVSEEGFPVVTADPNKANVWFILSGSSERDKIFIAGEYKFFPYDKALFETYPIKSPEQALKDLVEKKGYVANLGFNVDGNITLDRIYLAYYDPEIPSSFFQPVVVFEGRDDFLAYVPAVNSEYIEQTNSEEN